MKHTPRITPVRKEPPDLERFVAAMLAFVLARRAAEAEERQKAEADRD
jgi:hypothetical protein